MGYFSKGCFFKASLGVLRMIGIIWNYLESLCSSGTSMQLRHSCQVAHHVFQELAALSVGQAPLLLLL